jgi:phosphoglycolate phosphatase
MRAVIFDFDGTIANSFDYVFDYLCTQAGIKPGQEPNRDTLRGMSMKSMARKLGVPFWRLPYIYFDGRRVMREHIMLVEPFDGIPEVVRRLTSEGYLLFIVSANSAKNIKWFLRHRGLKHEFVAIRGGAGLFGKVSLITMLLTQYKIAKKDCWYVGDSLGDVAAAKAVGVKSVGVTWGFASADHLGDLRPDLLVRSPDGILGIIGK